jgi:hypothetical protein
VVRRCARPYGRNHAFASEAGVPGAERNPVQPRCTIGSKWLSPVGPMCDGRHAKPHYVSRSRLAALPRSAPGATALLGRGPIPPEHCGKLDLATVSGGSFYGTQAVVDDPQSDAGEWRAVSGHEVSRTTGGLARHSAPRCRPARRRESRARPRSAHALPALLAAVLYRG